MWEIQDLQKTLQKNAAFGISKDWQTRALENKGQLAQFYAAISEDFCSREILSLKFMQMFVDQGTFCYTFCVLFHSCYNSYALPQFGMSQNNSFNA